MRKYINYKSNVFNKQNEWDALRGATEQGTQTPAAGFHSNLNTIALFIHGS